MPWSFYWLIWGKISYRHNYTLLHKDLSPPPLHVFFAPSSLCENKIYSIALSKRGGGGGGKSSCQTSQLFIETDPFSYLQYLLWMIIRIIHKYSNIVNRRIHLYIVLVRVCVHVQFLPRVRVRTLRAPAFLGLPKTGPNRSVYSDDCIHKLK
jgi:hypothetical protein